MPNRRVPFKGRTGRGLTYRTLALAPERFTALKAYRRERGATASCASPTRSLAGCSLGRVGKQVRG